MQQEKKLEVKIDAVVPLANYLKSTLNLRGCTIAIFLIKILEKYTGLKILVSVPKQLINSDGSLIEQNAIKTLIALQSLGIVEKIIKKENNLDEIKFFSYNAYSPSNKQTMGFGRDFFSDKKALWKAIGECVERYLWYNYDFFSNNLVLTPYLKIKNKALNIFSLAGFSQEQKNKNSFLQFNENTILNWIPARSLLSKKQILCPIQLISAFYCNKIWNKNNKEKAEPILRWNITTGLSTGRNLEEAIVKGILEVIERDAFMISYLNKLSPPIIDLDYLSMQDEEIAKIVKNFKRYNLEIILLQLPTDFSDVNIIAALIIDRTGLGPALNIGARAGFDLKNNILNALIEAVGVRYYLKHKNRFKQKIDLNKIGKIEREIYWGKPENLHKINFFLKGLKIKINLYKNTHQNNDDKKYYKEKLNFLIQQLKEKKYEAVYVELTPKKIQKLGLRSIFVIIPELQPLHLIESIPYFGGKRLKEVPLKLGYQPLEELNQEPHPFP